MSEHYWCSDNNMFDGEILGHLHYQYIQKLYQALLWVASIGITFEIFPHSHSEPKVMKAVTTLGRQLGGETFVFGPTVQLCSNSDLIPLESQEYEWVQQVVGLASVIQIHHYLS